jgi:multisubunit Na+/H+ antiporter MnhC subunit
MSVTLVLLAVMAVLYAAGVYLLLERSMTRVLIGFLLVGNATNILILVMAGRRGLAPFYDGSTPEGDYADPLPQALILTAIVITFGVSAFLMALIYRSWRIANADRVQDDLADVAVRQGGAAGEEPSVPDEDTEFGERTAAAESQEIGNRRDLESAIDDSADDDDDREFRRGRTRGTHS